MFLVWLVQVLRSKESPLVSSVFFMCLPDKVKLPACAPVSAWNVTGMALP